MGRSIPTFRNLIEAYRDDMEPFRRAMRHQYRPAFVRLWEHAYYRTPSGKMADRGDPERVILFSMLVGLQQEVLELREQLPDSEDQRQISWTLLKSHID